MAEQTQTGKLEAQFTGLLNSPVNSWKPTHILVRQLKIICKEARLVFTDYSTDDEGNIIIQGLEEIETDEKAQDIKQ